MSCFKRTDYIATSSKFAASSRAEVRINSANSKVWFPTAVSAVMPINHPPKPQPWPRNPYSHLRGHKLKRCRIASRMDKFYLLGVCDRKSMIEAVRWIERD